MKDALMKTINMVCTLAGLVLLVVAIYQYYKGSTVDAIFFLLLSVYFDMIDIENLEED
jgi:phosphatidylserine synthase